MTKTEIIWQAHTTERFALEFEFSADLYLSSCNNLSKLLFIDILLSESNS